MFAGSHGDLSVFHAEMPGRPACSLCGQAHLADGCVLRVDKDDLEVLVGGVLHNASAMLQQRRAAGSGTT